VVAVILVLVILVAVILVAVISMPGIRPPDEAADRVASLEAYFVPNYAYCMQSGKKRLIVHRRLFSIGAVRSLAQARRQHDAG
jgi:hypothetical protein